MKTCKGFLFEDLKNNVTFYTDGIEVYRFPTDCPPSDDVRTGFPQGRWECSIEHWNRYAKAFKRPEVTQTNY